ncbi:MAG: tail fiber domain-containing protein [Cryomorphaceae bacterium]|nr:MAG: tail fiber domain-containing protein [Cryomorphaceae bacterium]
MKRIFWAFAFLLAGMEVVAQAPQRMNYQAVIRDQSDMLLTNTQVGIQISIIEESTFFPVFLEQHTANTNQNGLVTLEIGGGNILSGSLESIDWGNGVYSIQVDTDPNGGTDYTVSGTSNLLSVPYAFYAANAGEGGGQTTLNEAYNGGGAGEGRIIIADAGAVEIENAGGNTTALKVSSSVANSFVIDASQQNSGVAIRAESTNPANTFAAVQVETNSSLADNAALTAQNAGAGFALAGQIPVGATGNAAVLGSNFRTDGGSGLRGVGFNGTVGIATNAQGFGVFGANENPASGDNLSIGTYGIGFNGIFGQTTDVVQGWAGYFTADVGVEGTGFALGGWVNASDSRLKSEVRQIKTALDKITGLRGTHYTITTPVRTPEGELEQRTRQQYGVIAQELEAVFPEMVSERALFSNAGDDSHYKTVDYIQLIPVLLEAVKELNAEVKELRNLLNEVNNNE